VRRRGQGLPGLHHVPGAAGGRGRGVGAGGPDGRRETVWPVVPAGRRDDEG
jgi:hypothetical protein